MYISRRIWLVLKKIYSFKTASHLTVVSRRKTYELDFLTAMKREEDFGAEIAKMVQG